MKDKKPFFVNFSTIIAKTLNLMMLLLFLNLQFLNDDYELPQAEDLLYRKFPTFSVHFDEYFGDFSSASAQNPYDTKSSKT